MNLAVDREVLGHVPTVVTLAALDARRTCHVSSPVASLVRLHLFTYSRLEIRIANLSVLISIKVVKELFKLRFRCLDTPVPEIKLEILLGDRSAF